MDKLRFVLLAVDNNDYQVEQVSAAQTAAERLGIQLEVVHTEHDSIQQSQRVLDFVQAPVGDRPNAIFFEPVGCCGSCESWMGHPKPRERGLRS